MCHSLRGSVDWNHSLICIICCIIRHSLRGSVDWNRYMLRWYLRYCVTPYAGVWIEISVMVPGLAPIASHSLRGSVDWNTLSYNHWFAYQCHSLRGSVDWNLNTKHRKKVGEMSLPTRECGLKSFPALFKEFIMSSLPTRECGLKCVIVF